jgi:hypothetical protein
MTPEMEIVHLQSHSSEHQGAVRWEDDRDGEERSDNWRIGNQKLMNCLRHERILVSVVSFGSDQNGSFEMSGLVEPLG